MKKSDELKQALAAKREEVEKLQKAEDWNNALKAADELDKLCDELKVTLAMEQSNFENFMKDATPIFSTSTIDKEKLRNRAFNKILFNPARIDPKPLTDEERDAYYNVSGSPGAPGQIESVDSRGGVLVSPEQIKTLKEFREDYLELKNEVSVITTNTTSGTYPILPVQNLEFQPFAELSSIAESDLTFTSATYTIKDYGIIIPVSNQLVDDADIDIMSVIGRQLAEAAVKAENQEILKKLKGDSDANITAATTVSSYKALNTALFKTLDGVYEPSAKIFVNQDSFLWLSNLDDGQNRPLFVPDVVEPNKYRYRGKEIIVIPNATLPNFTSGADTFAPIFVGDMRQYITFFERQGVELATSRELYFRLNGMAIRAIERFGVIVTNPYSMITLKVKL